MTDRDGFTEAIRGIVTRLGGDADRVRTVRLEPSSDAAARGTYAAAGGVLTLGGTDVVAAASALARYLQVNGRRITWETPRLEPVFEDWPDAPDTEIRTPFTVRYYLNVVTHGYSTAYWDWQRWEREIDWMALHGITHPLILTAYEVVLEETLRRSGTPSAQARAWVGSAAHTPWMSMGGMHDFGGPLPARWAERRVDLGRRILGRAREFGMTPVLPLTGGHVPAALAGPGAPQIEWQGWRTAMLEPSSAAYADLVRMFLEVQREYLGDPGPHPVIAVDPYIESLPPSGDERALAAAGRGIHHAITAVHPGATWLLQGWPFHYHRDFWTPARVGAYLSDVPHERLLLIDLWGEHAPMWRDGMHGRRWLWSAIHNFGGRFALFGDLEGLTRDVAELRAQRPERLEGIGLAPEAIENNTVFYELATDLVWEAPDTARWLDAFATQRYGVTDERAQQVWRLLVATLYGPGRTRSIPSPVFARPWSATAPFSAQRLAGEALPAEPTRMSANIDAENDPAVQDDLPRIAQAARLLLGMTDVATNASALERDLVDLTGHLIAQRTREHIRGIVEASLRQDASAIGAHARRLRTALLDLDSLAATCAESRVSTWIDAARSWADDPSEAAAMERDARSLISVWGHQTSGLHDYSGRHWAGLIRDLHVPRWEAWAQWLAQAADRDTEPDVSVLQDRIVAIEERWRDTVGCEDRSDASAAAVAAVALDRLGY